ncbi:hypothetical protein KAM333_22730 [Aeromonas caviae]|uniref:hypothetical protein n=1 Tax=Aeromonas TaxID=642 RepID=UPI0011CA3804|nr:MULTISPECIES: hypothetical protein [Aeromonas]GJA06845.1 hypothetical protein KAM333_22730 [Aeromonas caviae]
MSITNGYLKDWHLGDSAFSSIDDLHKCLLRRPVPNTVRERLRNSDWNLKLLSEFQEQLSGYAINTLGLRYIKLDEAGRMRAFDAYTEMSKAPKFLPKTKKYDLAKRRWIGMALCAGLAMAKWDKYFEGAHLEKRGPRPTECSTEHNYLDLVASYLADCIERASEAEIHIDGIFEPEEILRGAQIILSQMVEPDRSMNEARIRTNTQLVIDGGKALEWFGFAVETRNQNCHWVNILAKAYGTTPTEILSIKTKTKRKPLNERTTPI